MVKTDYADILTMTEKLRTAMHELTMLSKKKVLVIDDDEPILVMVKDALQNDYNVATINSGNAALNLFLQGYIPNLVLLDLNMPEMGGWDAFVRIRNISQLHHIPIAIFTSSNDPKDKEKALALGAIEYIHKPVSIEELLEKITKLPG
jgi:putative two-component system response regulator